MTDISIRLAAPSEDNCGWLANLKGRIRNFLGGTLMEEGLQ